MDVERLVTWALLEQGLGWSMYGEASPVGWADLGTRIDCSSIGAPSPALQSDDDALVVKAAILALPDDVAGLIIQYGRIGGRPDWCPEGEGSWHHKVGANGRPAWHYEKPGDRRSPKKPVMEFVGWRPEQVALFRADYRVWWTGLEAMVTHLNGEMAGHQATGPAAPREPWTCPQPAILTPDGPLERRRPGASRRSGEYLDDGGRMVPRVGVRRA